VLIDAPEDQDFKVADVITDDLVLELIEALEEHQCEVCQKRPSKVAKETY